MSGILILAEHESGAIKKTTLELLSKGRELAEKLGYRVQVLLIGDDVKSLANSFAQYGADDIIIAEGDQFKGFNPHVYSIALKKAITDFDVKIVLFSHQFMHLDLGPCLSNNLNATFISNCADIKIINEKLEIYRSIYGDKLYARITYQESTPLLISAKSGIAKIKELKGEGNVIELRVDSANIETKVLQVFEEIKGADITKADIVVAVGRGVCDKSNIGIIKELAQAIRGTIACSRPLVDLGWLDKSCLVGISGRKVSPKLYIACGISGQMQHIEGMRDSEVIVAINKDPNAPILNVADYAIIGDLFQVVPALTEYLKKQFYT